MLPARLALLALCCKASPHCSPCWPPDSSTSRPACAPACSALRALCAFEAAGEDEAFCRRAFLHFRNLREAAALHKQLARQLEAQQARATVSSAAGAGAAPSLAGAGAGGVLPSPPPAVCEALRRALAAGWADQIARRVRSIDYLRNQEQQARGVAVGRAGAGW